MAMKIGVRLIATFGAVLALLLVICVTISVQMSRMNADTQSIANDHAAKAALGNQLEEGTYLTALQLYAALSERTPEAQQADVEIADAQQEKNAAITKDIASRLVTDKGQAAFDHLLQARESYAAALKPIHAQLAAHDSEGTSATLRSVVPFGRALIQAQTDFVTFEQGEMDAAVQESVGVYATARAVLWGVATVALIIAAVLGVLVTRSIVRPLQRVVEGAEALARGDLSIKVDVVRRDEVGAVAASLNRAISQLATIVGGVKQASASISSATHQLAAGNTDLSQRTEEQAASLEETAASTEELTATVRQNADNAQEAITLAGAASGIAQRGDEVVSRMVTTMNDISQSSTKIAEITGIIEGIAFQTNILALNAAVEAARAGEQGRGFAVVASEVRSLAQRSSIAAKEIKELIGTSVEKVHRGSELADEAGRTMSELARAGARVSDIVGEISSASQEQRTGIEQVSQAVTQMDQVTQQNAALVEEAAAAAHSMAEQAQSLRDAVAVFRIAEAEPSASRVVAERIEPRRSAPTVRTAPHATLTKPRMPPVVADRDTPVATNSGTADWQAF
jgi:methyl-accepting chemotaxis protein